jgi:tripeptidyl-peptidase-1
MKHFKQMISAILLTLLASVAARTTVESHKGFRQWQLSTEKLDSAHQVRITVAVKQQNTESLERELLKRSDPENKEYYGKWLTKPMVDSIVAPSKESVDTVRTWLARAGGSVESSTTGDFLSTTVSVADAEEKLFEHSAHYKKYVSGSLSIIRLNSTYTVPDNVAPHMDFLGPSVRFPLVQVKKPKAASSARKLFGPSGNDITPTILRKMYNATDAVAAPGTKNIQAVASFLGQFYSPSDLAKFFTKYSQESKITKPTVHGPNQADRPGIEAELDIQYVMGVGRDIPTQFWSTAGQQPGNPANEPFLVWLEAVGNLTDANLPLTFSISYGDNEPGVDMSYAMRVNTEFQKAGVRGTSIMFSSGDGGVSGGQSAPCTIFVPTFPASSPWVTAVGGTTKQNPEVCASFSSGGFSNYFARPSYQDAAVKGYFNSGQSGLPSSSLYNTSGAGIPDVSAQGENFDVIVNGFTNPVDGTSCSSPAFTGIVGLLNEARLSAGKTSLGYLNQLIYKTAGPAGAFNDVTKGSNPGCDTQGFPATKGWDPVTGWGTPNYGKLKDIVMSLP